MKPLIVYFIFTFLFLSQFAKGQHTEPVTVITNFVTGVLKADMDAVDNSIDRDSLYKHFCMDYAILPSDSIDNDTQLALFRILFSGGWGISFVDSQQLDHTPIFIQGLKFKVAKKSSEYLIVDYRFQLLKSKTIKLRCHLRFMNDVWKIISADSPSLGKTNFKKWVNK